MFKTLAQFKAANKASGRHFFDPDAMKFFNCRIESGIIAGRYFITSEQFDVHNPRLFSVRMANADGSVTTVSGFQKLATLHEARVFIKSKLENKMKF